MDHGILVFRRDGTYLKSIAKGEGLPRALHSRMRAGIYLCGIKHMAKYSLSGELIMKIEA